MVKNKPCGKCGSRVTTFEVVAADELWRRCLCGWRECVYSRSEGFVIARVDTATPQTVPPPGTKLRACLNQLSIYYPDRMTTDDVAYMARIDKKVVSAYLLVLMHKGLITRAESKKGVSGGSLWVATELALKLLEIPIRKGVI